MGLGVHTAAELKRTPGGEKGSMATRRLARLPGLDPKLVERLEKGKICTCQVTFFSASEYPSQSCSLVAARLMSAVCLYSIRRACSCCLLISALLLGSTGCALTHAVGDHGDGRHLRANHLAPLRRCGRGSRPRACDGVLARKHRHNLPLFAPSSMHKKVGVASCVSSTAMRISAHGGADTPFFP